jgi:hypothetical protein
MTASRRKIPTATQVLQRQKADHAPDGLARPTTAVVPIKQTGTAVTIPDPRSELERYLDEIAPASIVGRLIKFGKEGKCVTADDGEPIAEGSEFTALADQTLAGWIKFNGEGQPPDRCQGLLYDGFVMPPRETMGDVDQTKWPEGLDKQPADPWQHQMCLVLQNTETSQLFTFATSSKTGRRAIGTLLRHYNRMLKTDPGQYPVVKLQAGGFHHPDARIGWVATPMFTVVGRRSRDSAAKPDTSLGADLNDAIPDFGKKAP